MNTEGYEVTVFLVCSTLVLPLPPELRSLITVFDIPLPSDGEIEKIIEDYAAGYGLEIDSDVVKELRDSLRGFGKAEIEQILNMAYQHSGTLTADDTALILREKRQLIKKSSMLEIVDAASDINAIGGLDKLKSYLKDKAYIFTNLYEAKKNGVDLPKGILIVGMPGCGKSLTAKAVAGLFNAPLLRLDIGNGGSGSPRLNRRASMWAKAKRICGPP